MNKGEREMCGAWNGTRHGRWGHTGPLDLSLLVWGIPPVSCLQKCSGSRTAFHPHFPEVSWNVRKSHSTLFPSQEYKQGCLIPQTLSPLKEDWFCLSLDCSDVPSQRDSVLWSPPASSRSLTRPLQSPHQRLAESGCQAQQGFRPFQWLHKKPHRACGEGGDRPAIAGTPPGGLGQQPSPRWAPVAKSEISPPNPCFVFVVFSDDRKYHTLVMNFLKSKGGRKWKASKICPSFTKKLPHKKGNRGCVPHRDLYLYEYIGIGIRLFLDYY